MSFAVQLETLLDICRVSNAALARGLGVDASLVSRWKTGSRLPPEARRVAREIAVFLSDLPLRARDRETLIGVLGKESAANGLVAALERFIMGVPYLPRMDDVEDDSDNLLNRLCSLLSRDSADAMSKRGAINLWPRVQGGQPLEHEAFFGVTGRRQAVINVLYAALSSSRPGDLFLLLPENVGWITDDPVFSEVFSHALYSFAQRGRMIYVIHRRPESAQELFEALNVFFPHYLTGRLLSYNLPGESRPPAPTLFVAQGLCAMLTQRGGPKDETTIFYKNTIDTMRLDRQFKEYLSEARPMAQACVPSDPSAIPSTLYEMERQPGDCFTATYALNPLWAPESLEYGGLARRRETFFSRASRWVEIWPECLMRDIEINGSAPIGMRTLGGQPDSSLSGENLRLYLKNLHFLLCTYDNFHVILSETLSNVGYITYKRRVGALLLPQSAEEPYALFLRGADGLSLLDNWFSARIEGRDKRHFTERLGALLEAAGARETA